MTARYPGVINAQLDGDGESVVLRTPDTFVILSAYDSSPSATDAWVPLAGEVWRIQGVAVVGSVTGVYLFEDWDGATLRTRFSLPLTANVAVALNLGDGFRAVEADRTLRIDGPALSVINGTIWGRGGISGGKRYVPATAGISVT